MAKGGKKFFDQQASAYLRVCPWENQAEPGRRWYNSNHRFRSNSIFGRGPPNLAGIKYFDLIFCHDHLLTKPNIFAELERNWRFELYHLLPGFLVDTLLVQISGTSAITRLRCTPWPINRNITVIFSPHFVGNHCFSEYTLATYLP